jgi:hypothetical protein
MSGLLGDEELAAELDKHRANQWQIVRHAVISSLCQTLQLDGDLTSARKALSGLSRIAPEKTVARKLHRSINRLSMNSIEKQKQSAAREARLCVLWAYRHRGTMQSIEDAHWLEALAPPCI